MHIGDTEPCINSNTRATFSRDLQFLYSVTSETVSPGGWSCAVSVRSQQRKTPTFTRNFGFRYTKISLFHFSIWGKLIFNNFQISVGETGSRSLTLNNVICNKWISQKICCHYMCLPNRLKRIADKMGLYHSLLFVIRKTLRTGDFCTISQKLSFFIF